MAYAVIQPPFTLRFSEMPRAELKAYAAWFHQVLPTRVVELARAVNSTPGFEAWEANATPESLELLGKWFEQQVETRPNTQEEIEEETAGAGFPLQVPAEELTNRTFSIAMDIGMYFGQVVLKNVPGTRGDQPLKSKNFVDYGQPVIIGLGTVPLNPVGVMVTVAYGISRGRYGGEQVRKVYDIWAAKKTQ